MRGQQPAAAAGVGHLAQLDGGQRREAQRSDGHGGRRGRSGGRGTGWWSSGCSFRVGVGGCVRRRRAWRESAWRWSARRTGPRGRRCRRRAARAARAARRRRRARPPRRWPGRAGRRRRSLDVSKPARRSAASRAPGSRQRTVVPWPASSACRLSSARIRPCPITTRRSTVACTSARRWLDSSTVPPPAANSCSSRRIQRMPSGSMPLAGSSRISTAGSPSSAVPMPRRWRMPSE